MLKRIFLIAIMAACAGARADPPIDYTAQRLALAASSDYNAYSLQLLCYGLMQEYRDLAADSKASIMQINRPVQGLVEAYPLGVQVNLALADFLEYVARNADPSSGPEQAQQLVDLAKTKRQKAADILASILSSGDGTSTERAFVVINIMEEHAVLESRGLRGVSQSLVEENGKRYDAIVAEAKDGTRSTNFFDVSLFYQSEPTSQ